MGLSLCILFILLHGQLYGIRALAQPQTGTDGFQDHGDHKRVDGRDADSREPPLGGDAHRVAHKAGPVPSVQMRHCLFQRGGLAAPAHHIVGDHNTRHRGEGRCQEAEPRAEVTVQAKQTDHRADHTKDHQQLFALDLGKDRSQIQGAGIRIALCRGPDVGEQTDECQREQALLLEDIGDIILAVHQHAHNADQQHKGSADTQTDGHNAGGGLVIFGKAHQVRCPGAAAAHAGADRNGNELGHGHLGVLLDGEDTALVHSVGVVDAHHHSGDAHHKHGHAGKQANVVHHLLAFERREDHQRTKQQGDRPARNCREQHMGHVTHQVAVDGKPAAQGNGCEKGDKLCAVGAKAEPADQAKGKAGAHGDDRGRHCDEEQDRIADVYGPHRLPKAGCAAGDLAAGAHNGDGEHIADPGEHQRAQVPPLAQRHCAGTELRIYRRCFFVCHCNHPSTKLYIFLFLTRFLHKNPNFGFNITPAANRRRSMHFYITAGQNRWVCDASLKAVLSLR